MVASKDAASEAETSSAASPTDAGRAVVNLRAVIVTIILELRPALILYIIRVPLSNLTPSAYGARSCAAPKDLLLSQLSYNSRAKETGWTRTSDLQVDIR